uniref:Mating type protein MAT-2 n=1 Tax=Cochliobolus cymbopogonis TaxID=90976 RepID=Q9Y8C9_COCCY|nr:mating type protein MAT-2 [Curvularia cymbopogonis]
MNAATAPTVASANGLSLANALKIAEARFEAAIEDCKDEWANGHEMVILQDNIPELFGGILVEHFKRFVGEACAFPVNLIAMDGGNGNYHTLVQLPKNMHPRQVDSGPSSAQTSPSEHKSGTNASAAGLKKAPRPMNCWIIFRDAMSKHLKAEFPNLSVQEISTRCSAIWANLPAEAKQPWRAAAESAKEEHSRLHPDYKYSPRKPGQKKKRQSRKLSKRLVARAEQMLHVDLLASSPESTDQFLLSDITTTTEEVNDIPGDAMQFPSTAINPFFDAESFRQGLLEAEFGPMFNLDTTFPEFDDGMLCFHDETTGDAALPAVFQNMY